MTIFIGIVLLLIGLASLGLYPPLRMAGPILLAGVVILILRATGALAADKELIISRPAGVAAVHSRATRRAVAGLERHRKMSQRDFENMLLRSSNAKDRLE